MKKKTDIVPIDCEPGTHDLFCAMCGKKYTTITHFGGKNKLKVCRWCMTLPACCLGCFVLAETGKKLKKKKYVKKKAKKRKKEPPPCHSLG